LPENRLTKQVEFIVELDKLKGILRRTHKINESAYENDAEHSWHLATMALILQEHSDEAIDLTRVLKMVLIHDVVEIDAGDTFAYDDDAAHRKKEIREEQAAQRIFGLLPKRQGCHLYELWREFEARETPEARFAAAMDRFQPLLHNYLTHGAAWKDHEITAEQVLERNRPIAEGSKHLWDYVLQIVRDSVHRGYLRDS